LILAARISLAHFSMSAAMAWLKSAGEVAKGVTPSSAKWCSIALSARPALISLLSLSTISGGVPLGAPMPNQPLAS
jgi:hypothetical protein